MNRQNLLIGVVFFSTLKVASILGNVFLSFLIPVILSSFALLVGWEKKLIGRHSLFIIAVAFLILFSLIISLTIGHFGFASYLLSSYVMIIIYVLIVGMFLVQSRDILSRPHFWIKTTKIVILFHALLLSMQIVAFYFFNTLLDVGALTGGAETRSIVILSDSLRLFRGGGLFEEPSIYVGFIFPFICLRYINNGNKIDYIIMLGLGGVIVTLSIVGCVLVILFFIVVFFRFNIKLLLILTMLLLVAYYYSSDYLLFRLDKVLNGNDGSSSVKLSMLVDYFNNDVFFKGYGLLRKSDFNGAYDGLGDTTVYTSLFTIFGFPIGLLLIIPLLYKIITMDYGIRQKVLLSLCFVKLASPTYMFFWTLYLIVCLVGKNNK